MKKYYIHYYNDFGNTYNLYWAETAEQVSALPDGAEQITRKQAEALARAERASRKTDPSFSGYADSAIFPADYDRNGRDIRDDCAMFLDGLVWDYK